MPGEGLRVLLFQSHDYARHKSWWIAQCLEYDLAAQGETIDDAVYEIQRSLFGQFVVSVEMKVSPFANIPRAPDKFEKLYETAAHKIVVPRPQGMKLPNEIPAEEAERARVAEQRVLSRTEI